MPSISNELDQELSELLEAAQAFGAKPSLPSSELVCIRSRAAIATFKMHCVWARAVDPVLKNQVLRIFGQAVELLKPHYTGKNAPGIGYFERVCSRREELKGLTVETIRDELPALS